MFYLALFNGLVALRYVVPSVRQRRQLYPFLLAFLFVFSAFRFEVGCDWRGYLRQFHVLGLTGQEQISIFQEPLWTALIQLLNRFAIPYPWLNVVSSALFFLGMHAVARRQPDPLSFLVLLVPILIINMPMSGIRQGAAIGIMGLAFAAFIDRKLIRFLALTATAGLIHSSAFVFFLMAPLVTGRYSRRRLLMSGVLALPGLAALLRTESAQLALERYAGTDIEAAGAAFRLIILTLTALLYLLMLRRRWVAAFPEDYKLVTVSSFVMLGMILLVPFSSVIGDRLGYYLVPIQTMIFARIPYLVNGRSRQLWTFAPYLGLIVVFAVWSNLSALFKVCYLPYQTWLFGYPQGVGYVF